MADHNGSRSAIKIPAMRPLEISKELSRKVSRLRFRSPVAKVYNPLDYALGAFSTYLCRYGNGTREALLIGMNPGPWGMAQTGIPFGEVNVVRDWLGIRGGIEPPADQHPRRPVLGLACKRSEVSGRRIWGWAQEAFGAPEKFFRRFLILNYCPLCFMEESGRNVTPDKLPANEREPLFAACDAALRGLVECYRPKFVVAVGGFVEARAKESLGGLPVTIGRILHPSPASPLANKGWAKQAMEQMRQMGIVLR